MELYFRDNFFNSGQTDILNEHNEAVGTVDLKSTFGTALDVYALDGTQLYSGRFPFLSNKWIVMNGTGDECGLLRYRMSFLSKRYEYEAYGRGVYEITSPAFSQEYEIRGENGDLSASFTKISGWFASSAYCLQNRSGEVDSYEWIAVIMGMNEMQRNHG